MCVRASGEVCVCQGSEDCEKTVLVGCGSSAKIMLFFKTAKESL